MTAFSKSDHPGVEQCRRLMTWSNRDGCQICLVQSRRFLQNSSNYIQHKIIANDGVDIEVAVAVVVLFYHTADGTACTDPHTPNTLSTTDDTQAQSSL
ncbi:hypothetical protein CEXT_28251 [Caerostris extrusa]|uniref:Uncharacterized protein n=1 Tax=Caerostris extrusa TaxID=172846 RepID=A0AAV4TWL0_CAEEX|nr:hypothetical protein CEXT_28251 [Caerostris extrusa]